MITTAITRKLGIKYPLIGGAMMNITTPEFVAAVSNAGGLGILASAIYHTKEKFAEAVDRIRDRTDKPFAVNINLFPSVRPINNNDYFDVLVDKKVGIVETSGHSAPAELCGRFKAAGMIWLHKCVGVRYALKVESMGADIITVVGQENGGATGKMDVGTLVLVPAVVDAVKVPVIGGGGVADGRGVAALLSLGAAGVIMGTRLLATQECPIHSDLKEALIKATENDTMIIMRTLNASHRVWCNSAAWKCVEIEKKGGDFSEVISVVAGEKAKKMYDEGDLDAGVVSCGQGIGLISDIPPVKDLFDRIMSQAEGIVKGLAGDCAG